MAQLTNTASGVEVRGEIVLAMIKGMGGLGKRLRHVLAEHGLDYPRPDHWYSQDDLLEALEAIAAGGTPFVVFNMGTQVADDAEFPPEIDSIEKALTHLDALHGGGHRVFSGGGHCNAKTGSYAFEKTGERSGAIVCRTPYACDFDRGLIEATVRRFRPQGSWDVTVKHADSLGCRKLGGDGCTYLVGW